MPENEQQWSDEEQAEAERFNQMVTDEKLTPAEVSQIEKDKTPEEVEAEQEAMEKVIDLGQDEYCIHETRLKNLDDDLAKGLLSPYFALRLQEYGIQTSYPQELIEKAKKAREEGIPQRANLVYYMPSGWIESQGWGIFGDVSILLSKKIAESDSKQHLDPTVKRRIRPEFIIGIAVKEGLEDQVIPIANKHGLPVYNRKMGLVAPHELKYEQVQQFVAEREAKKKEEGILEVEEAVEEGEGQGE